MKEYSSAESKKPSLAKLVRKVKLGLEGISLSEETKPEVEKRNTDPLDGAKTNVEFVRKTIVPIFSDLTECEIINTAAKANLTTDFGTRLPFDPQKETKFIMFDGARLNLCLSFEKEEKDFVIIKEIKSRDEIRTLCSRQGEEGKRALSTFGRLSKKEIISCLISALDALVPQESAAAKPSEVNLINRIGEYVGKLKTTIAGNRM